MAVLIQRDTVQMTADYVGAKPGVAFTKRNQVDMAVLHQGRNSGPIVQGTIRSRASAAAIKISASVTVVAGRRDEITNQYQFHLLQLVWKPVDSALYAGKVAADGSMKFDFTAAPFFPAGSPFLLDADETGASPFPYVENAAAVITPTHSPGMWTVSLSFHDHPFVDRPLTLPNFATKDSGGGEKTNFLYDVERSLFFFTHLVARDINTGDLIVLGFLNWKSVLKAEIRWKERAGAFDLSTVVHRAYFTSDDYLPGAPNDAAKKLLMDLPAASDTYNAVESRGLAGLIGSTRNSAAVQASKTWTGAVPATHFAP